MADSKSYDYARCLQSEQAAVGSCLILDQIIPVVKNYMNPSRFYHKQLSVIFQAVCALFDSKRPVDVVTVAEELRKKNLLESCGGGPYLSDLINSVAFAQHGEHYAKIAANYYYEREIISLAGDLVCSAADEASREKSCTDYLDILRQTVLARNQIGLPDEFNYTDSLHGLLDSLSTKKTGKTYEVGFPNLDTNFGGIFPGEVITWGAAPNGGKSIMMLNIASHCLIRGDSVLYFATEMTSEETAWRHVSMLTSIDPYTIRTRNFSAGDVEKINSVMADRMHKKPMRIIDSPEPSLEDIEAALTSGKVDVVFLDYLQRFKLPNADNYRLQVNEFMRKLKNLARRYNVVIHLASQLSREAYGKDETRPILSHLSESSGIEKESDRVILIWSPKDKNKNVTPKTKEQFLEIILAKNRHGRRGAILDLILDNGSLRISEVPDLTQTEAPFS